MNATRIIMTCAVLLCCAGLARGTVVSVDLPELVGRYELDEFREDVSVDLGTTFASIDDVQLHVTGMAEPGLAHPIGQEGQYVVIPPNIGSYMYPESGEGHWSMSADLGDHMFDTTRSYQPRNGATWEFLLDGQIEVTTGNSLILVAWLVLDVPPAFYITQAELIVSGVAAGDTDMDYDIDGADLAAVGVNWAPAATDKVWADGDFDGDGDVDGSDLAGLGLNWNPVQQIPESMSLCMIMFGSIVLVRRSRR